MKPTSNHLPQLFYLGLVMRKWLHITARASDFSADPDDEDDLDSDLEDLDGLGRDSRLRDHRTYGAQTDSFGNLPMSRRRKSETFRAQYINTKELRICVGTWNVGGKAPPDDLDIDDWLDVDEPADIYVLGLQEIVPLNAGNIFGPEDSRPVPKWENIIRDTLNRIRHVPNKIKSYSDPPSPSKFKPFDDIPDIEELSLDSDSDVGEEIHPLDDETNGFGEFKDESTTDESMLMNSEDTDCTDSSKICVPVDKHFQRQFSSSKRLDRLNCLRTEESTGNTETLATQQNCKLIRMLSGTERIGLSWPEPPMHLLPVHALERPNSLRSFNSFQKSKSFRAYTSFKSSTNEMSSDLALLADIDLEALMKRKRRSPFVKIVSKKMVGIFISVWVRRSLRRHIQNVKVSTVGVGVMGYIGNKGSVSVSMSIHQTMFCFICTHLTSGEKDGDENKRNADVHEIYRRTHFHSDSSIGLPKRIQDHEKIIWLGDLNYRLNLSYEKARELIFRKEWSKLLEKDQLVRELRKGRAFDGWLEGTLNFPPTYKYEINSEKYYGGDPKIGKRTPAWCDRILSYGKGLRLLSYRRAELKLSDHRPVTATYMAEVEVFSPRKLQRALTFTDAEIENDEDEADNLGVDFGMSCYRVEEEDISNWEH